MCVKAGFVSFHLLDHAGMRNWNAAVFHKNLIPISMIGMMISVKGKSDWLLGQGANFTYNQPCSCRKICVDHQHIVFKHDPAVVADCVSSIGDSPFVKVNIRSYQVLFGSFSHSSGHRSGQELRLRRDAQKCAPRYQEVAPADFAHVSSFCLHSCILNAPLSNMSRGTVRAKIIRWGG